MTWGIQEGNLSSVGKCHIVGTDMLRDTTGLTGNHVCLADIVEQRSLTVVHMTHHGYNRGTRNEIVLIVLLFGDGVLHLGTHVFGLESELIGHDIDGLCIQALVDTYHDTDTHTGTDYLVYAYVHHRSQLRNGHKLRQLQHLALCRCSSSLLGHLLMHGFALLLTVFGTLLILVLLVGQTGQRLLYLACYCLIVHLQRLLVALLVLLIGILAATLLLVVGVVIVLLVLSSLLSGSLNVNALIADTLTLLLLAVLLGSLFLTFLAALFLRFLLRASALVQGIKVNLTQDVHLRRSLLLTLQGEYFGRSRSSRGCSRCFGFFFFHLSHLFNYLFRLSLRLGFLFLRGLGLRFGFGYRFGFGLGFGLWLRFGFRLSLFNHRFHFSLRTHGSCLRLFLCRFLSRFSRFLPDTRKVNLAKRLKLLGFGLGLGCRLLHYLWLRRFLLLLRMFLEQLLRLGAYLLVFLELIAERLILLVVQFETQVGSHLTQVTLLFQELHCRLESYVQFADCFI